MASTISGGGALHKAAVHHAIDSRRESVSAVSAAVSDRSVANPLISLRCVGVLVRNDGGGQ